MIVESNKKYEEQKQIIQQKDNEIADLKRRIPQR
jgi:hypothetical protein